MRVVTRALLPVLVLAAAGFIAACGGGDDDDRLTGDSVRACLTTEASLSPNAPKGAAVDYAPTYLNTAPDFTLYSKDGSGLDVIVLADDQRARRTAADVESAMLPLGISDAAERVVVARNAVAVFDSTPAAPEREAVAGCLDQ